MTQPAREVKVTLPSGEQYSADSFATLAEWARQGRVPSDAVIEVQGLAPVVAYRHPALQNILQGGPGVASGDGVATVIPYKNPPALVGYYISIVSLIPFVGLLAGPAAVILGIVGIRRVRREPACKGTAHAVVAIVLGGLVTLGHLGVIIAIIIADS